MGSSLGYALLDTKGRSDQDLIGIFITEILYSDLMQSHKSVYRLKSPYNQVLF